MTNPTLTLPLEEEMNARSLFALPKRTITFPRSRNDGVKSYWDAPLNSNETLTAIPVESSYGFKDKDVCIMAPQQTWSLVVPQVADSAPNVHAGASGINIVLGPVAVTIDGAVVEKTDGSLPIDQIYTATLIADFNIGDVAGAFTAISVDVDGLNGFITAALRDSQYDLANGQTALIGVVEAEAFFVTDGFGKVDWRMLSGGVPQIQPIGVTLDAAKQYGPQLLVLPTPLNLVGPQTVTIRTMNLSTINQNDGSVDWQSTGNRIRFS